MKRAQILALPLATLSLAVAAPSFAQDRAAHFDGPYVGVSVGTALQNNDRGDTLVFDTNRDGRFDQAVLTSGGLNAFSPGFCNGSSTGRTPDTGCTDDDDGIEYAVRLGYDARLGDNLVAGLIVEGSKHDSTDGTSGFSTTPAGYSITRGLDHSIAARGRVGFTPGGGALFYAMAGVSYAKLEQTFATTNTANAFAEVNDDDWTFGGQVGGGAEVMLTDKVSFGLEYLYSKYDDDYYVEVTRGTAATNNPFLLNGGGTFLRASDTEFDFHTVKATLNYRF